MRSTLDRILLGGLADRFKGFDVHHARVALAAIAQLDASARARILEDCAEARAAPTKDAAPPVDEFEAVLGLLFFESSKIGWKAEPDAVVGGLRERRANEPQSLPQRVLQWRAWGFRQALYSYDQVPLTMRIALDRMLVESGHAALHDHPDPLTFAKALTLVIFGGFQMPPNREEFAALSEEDIEAIVQAIIESKSSALYQSSYWFDWPIKWLLATRLDLIRKHLPRMAQAQIISPDEMYWEAGQETAEVLLSRVLALPSAGWSERVALCWTRHAASIHEAARKLSRDSGRAKWNKEYMRQANAELLENGSIRELGLRDCRRIIRKNNDEGLQGVELTLFSPANLKCPGCDGALAIIFDLDLALPEFASVAALAADPMGARRLRIAGCAVCAYYHNYGEPRIFAQFDWEGGVRAGPNDGVPAVAHDQDDFTIGLASETKAWLVQEPMTPIAPLVGQCGYGSCFGGYPKWEQDNEYPACAGCSRLMLFVGSLSMLDLANGDPSIYAFICPQCCLSTVAVQTT